MLCVTILLCNGCVLCPVTKLLNYNKLTSSLPPSLALSLPSASLSLAFPLFPPNCCHPVYVNPIVVLISVRLESQCQVLSGPNFGEISKLFLRDLTLLALSFNDFCVWHFCLYLIPDVKEADRKRVENF